MDSVSASILRRNNITSTMLSPESFSQRLEDVTFALLTGGRRNLKNGAQIRFFIDF